MYKCFISICLQTITWLVTFDLYRVVSVSGTPIPWLTSFHMTQMLTFDIPAASSDDPGWGLVFHNTHVTNCSVFILNLVNPPPTFNSIFANQQVQRLMLCPHTTVA